jgi:hypothetical protein
VFCGPACVPLLCCVVLTEYEWREPLAAGLGADEILALVLKADARPQADLRETIRLVRRAWSASAVVPA